MEKSFGIDWNENRSWQVDQLKLHKGKEAKKDINTLMDEATFDQLQKDQKQLLKISETIEFDKIVKALALIQQTHPVREFVSSLEEAKSNFKGYCLPLAQTGLLITKRISIGDPLSGDLVITNERSAIENEEGYIIYVKGGTWGKKAGIDGF